MKQLKPATWFGEQLLQEWGHWCVQYLETFGTGAGGASDGGESRMTRAPGEHCDPVLAALIGSELKSALHQSIHLRIAERPALDRRVAVLRYVGKLEKLPMCGDEPVIWKGEIPIGGGNKGLIEYPEPHLLKTVCVPIPEPTPNVVGHELGVTAEEVREATRRLRALAVKAFRRHSEKNKRAKAPRRFVAAA